MRISAISVVLGGLARRPPIKGLQTTGWEPLQYAHRVRFVVLTYMYIQGPS